MDVLGRNISIDADEKDLDLPRAKEIAKEKAREFCDDPMLLSWYQGKTREGFPNFECGKGDKPAWIVYAESRGGDLTININDGEFIFFFLSLYRS
jgi:hypothetical protein